MENVKRKQGRPRTRSITDYNGVYYNITTKCWYARHWFSTRTFPGKADGEERAARQVDIWRLQKRGDAARDLLNFDRWDYPIDVSKIVGIKIIRRRRPMQFLVMSEYEKWIGAVYDFGLSLQWDSFDEQETKKAAETMNEVVKGWVSVFPVQFHIQVYADNMWKALEHDLLWPAHQLEQAVEAAKHASKTNTYTLFRLVDVDSDPAFPRTYLNGYEIRPVSID